MAFNSLNTWTGVGRITADPELKTTSSGVSVTGFTLAVDRAYAKEGNRQTDFIPCTAFRGTADFICKYAHKGDVVGVVGALQSRKYEDKEGKSRTTYEVIVNEVSICNGKKGDGNGSASAAAQLQKDGSANIDVVADDDDLPF